MKNKSEKQNKLESLLKNKVNETSKKVKEQAKDVYIKAIDSAQAGLEKAKQKSLNKESKEETIKENVSVDSINNFEDIPNDNYFYNKELNLITGRKTKNRYMYGDKICVKVVKANRETSQVDFVIV